MIAVLRRRNFAFLWFGGLVSLLGDSMMGIALPFHVYQLTESALATGVVRMADALPSVLLGSVAGVFVDRWDRRRTMIVTNLLLALVILPLLAVRSPEWLWVVYVVALASSTVAQFLGPAESALLPKLVGEEHLAPANSLNALNNSLSNLVGPAVGGALLGLLGFRAVVLLNSASFVLAAAMIAFIASSAVRRGELNGTDSPPKAATNLRREWWEGLGLVGRSRLVATLFFVMGTLMLGQGIVTVMLVVFVTDVLGGGALEFGLLGTAQGIGGLAGAVVAGYAGRILAPRRLVALGTGASGLIVLGMVTFPTLPAVLTLVALIGLPVLIVSVNVQMLLQSGVVDRLLGRVFGALGTTLAAASMVGIGVASALGDAVGPTALLAVTGGLWLLAGVVAAATLPSSGPTTREATAPQMPAAL
jgi:predicted MFS family arabinose efflux permease